MMETNSNSALSASEFGKMRFNVALLSMCQAFMFVANSVFIASAALVGAALADDIMHATIPVSLVFVFAMLFAIPASALMKLVGRRAGFQIGSATGCVGAVVCAHAVMQQSFIQFCIGISLLGIHNAFGNFYRFAAADVSTESYKSRAISYVLAGSVIAAFIGPNMANATKSLVEDALFAGSYAALAVCYMLGFIVISFLQVPNERAPSAMMPGRPLLKVAKQPAFVVSVVSATVGYGVMNLLMTSTPLAMEVMGHDFMYTAQVIQWHIVAMFAPSFFTGHLIRRFGELNIILWGFGALFGGIMAGMLMGSTVAMFLTALVLIGIGWNFTFLGGTTMLTSTYQPSEKAKAQGFNDFCVAFVVSGTALLSGILHHLWGWHALCAVTAVPVLVTAAYAAWLRFRPQDAVVQTS